MSAFVLSIQDDEIILLTDTAAYTSDGTVQFFDSKIHCLPSGKGVLWSRGDCGLPRSINNVVDRAGCDFDTLVVNLASVANSFVRIRNEDVSCEVGIAGWSTRRNRRLEAHL